MQQLSKYTNGFGISHEDIVGLLQDNLLTFKEELC